MASAVDSTARVGIQHECWRRGARRGHVEAQQCECEDRTRGDSAENRVHRCAIVAHPAETASHAATQNCAWPVPVDLAAREQCSTATAIQFVVRKRLEIPKRFGIHHDWLLLYSFQRCGCFTLPPESLFGERKSSTVSRVGKAHDARTL